jgi:hypothetical protein
VFDFKQFPWLLMVLFFSLHLTLNLEAAFLKVLFIVHDSMPSFIWAMVLYRINTNDRFVED